MDITSIQGVVDFGKELGTQNNKLTGTDFSQTLQKAVEEQNADELKESCRQIESYMLSYVFKKMKESMLTGEGITEKGDYEKMFEDSMIETMCESMVQAGGVGLADSMYKQMLSTYQAQNSMSNESVLNASQIDKEI